MRAHAEKGEITIRPATSRDRDLIVEFNRALAEETEPDPGSGETERRVVGQMMVTYEFSDWRATGRSGGFRAST